MRCVADRDVFENDTAAAGRPPGWRIYGPRWLLLQVEELDDAFDGDEVHLELTVALAEFVRVPDDCSFVRIRLGTGELDRSRLTIRGSYEHKSGQAGCQAGVQSEKSQQEAGNCRKGIEAVHQPCLQTPRKRSAAYRETRLLQCRQGREWSSLRTKSR